MKKIDKLTVEQEQELIQFRQRMWDQGVSCAPVDRAAAEKAITEAYAEIGRRAPKFFWMPSPMTSSLALYALKKFAETAERKMMKPAAGLMTGLRDGLWDGLWDGLRDGLGDGLRTGLRTGLRDGLMTGLRDGLRDGLGDGLRTGLRDDLRTGLGDGLWDGLRDGLGDGLRTGLRTGLRDGLGDGLGDGLWDGLWDGLRDGLGDGLRTGLRDDLRTGLGDGLWDGLRDGLGDAVRDSQTYWWGQMDTYWLSFYRFGTDLGVPQRDVLLRRLDIMERIAASCGFWYPRDGICIVSDRFASVHWDESRNRVGLPFRLHCEDAPAVSFRDGWGLYYWHGYRLPIGKEWIIAEKHKITPDSIDAEPNAELRRVMLEVFGFERYIDARGAKVVDEDEMFGRPRRLLEMTVQGDQIRVIDVWNGSLEPDGSRRRFFLGAMTGADTAHEAIARSYGVDPAFFSEGLRT